MLSFLAKEKRFSKTEWSWIFYDWANSIYATNISAAIFPILYSQVAGKGTTGDLLYGYAVSLANLLVAVLAPYLGSIADFRGMKKKLWTIFLLVGVVFTAIMGVVGSWKLMLVGFVLSRIGFSGSCLFYDSFLTDVTTKDRMDKVSTWGFAMGYIGGSTIPFLISIAIMLMMKQSELSMRIAVLIVPVWWLLFSIPFMKNVHQVSYVDTPPSELGKVAWKNTIHTLQRILKDKAVLFFLAAYFFYIDGVDTIISMATKYGDTLLHPVRESGQEVQGSEPDYLRGADVCIHYGDRLPDGLPRGLPRDAGIDPGSRHRNQLRALLDPGNAGRHGTLPMVILPVPTSSLTASGRRCRAAWATSAKLSSRTAMNEASASLPICTAILRKTSL